MDQGNEARSPKSSLFIGEEVSESESPADLKASSRDFARQEPRRGRKLRTVVGAAAVLGGGWVMGLNSQFNMAQSRVWFDEGAIKVSSAVASVQRGVLDRREHLTRAFRQRRSSARRLTASFQTCHRARIEASTMAWDHINTKPRSPRPERPAMFLVQLHDGGRVMLNLPKNIAALGPCAVLSAALNRQSLGELPAGRIERLVRIR